MNPHLTTKHTSATTSSLWIVHLVNRAMAQLGSPRLSRSLALVAFALSFCSSMCAEDIGAYTREDQNLGPMALRVDQLKDKVFWLKSDVGVVRNAQGNVVEWLDQSGNDHRFKVYAAAEKTAQLNEIATAEHAAVAFQRARFKSAALVSPQISLDPKRGMTAIVVAKPTEHFQDYGYLLAYGLHHNKPGNFSMLTKGNHASSWFQVRQNTKQQILSLDDRASQNGYAVLAARVDAGKKQMDFHHNGVFNGQQRCEAALASAYPFSIGGTPNGQWGASAEILEVIVLNRVLDDQSLLDVQRNLMGKYGIVKNAVSHMAKKYPYAYYPYTNELEVAVDLREEHKAQLKKPVQEVGVHLIEESSKRLVSEHRLALDGQFRGQEIFGIPDLKNGRYRVVYKIGELEFVSPVPLLRKKYAFEHNTIAKDRQVAGAFDPVRYQRRGDELRVEVVDRSMSFDSQGQLIQVHSLEQPLLAAPMVWRLDASHPSVGKATWVEHQKLKVEQRHEDEVRLKSSFRDRDQSLQISQNISIEEDGCMAYEVRLKALQKNGRTIERLQLEIPLKSEEAKLFHFIADNALRYNYAGALPSGREITWYSRSWDHWVPIRWRNEKGHARKDDKVVDRVLKATPSEQVLWSSFHTKHHGVVHHVDHRDYVPYLWLGAERRGLSFFMESDRGFVLRDDVPCHEVVRRGDQVLIRVNIIQKPTLLKGERTLRFGLMASPGKPMAKDYRTRKFASGLGPVLCWGGWLCSSKYPEGHDWSIVDKIQEVRAKGEMSPEDIAWIEAKGEVVQKRWPNRRPFRAGPEGEDWTWFVKHFAKLAVRKGRLSSGTYFEEHATDIHLEEWEVFQDEWTSAEFNRFREKDANWGVFAPSYQDFAIYTANEWFKRGVNLYFDNCNPKRNYNYHTGSAYRSKDGVLKYGISLMAQRRYYKRVYKLLQSWNAQRPDAPLDFTLHMTNTQTLPLNTWGTATLDLEQRAHNKNPDEYPPEVPFKARGKQKEGFQLPWNPAYTRVMTAGLKVGTIPLALDHVAGHHRFQSGEYSSEMMLRDWGMRMVHDIRAGAQFYKSCDLSRKADAVYQALLNDEEAQVVFSNYWDESKTFKCSRDDVKWVAMTSKPKGVALWVLQSYAEDAVDVEWSWPRDHMPQGVEVFDVIRGDSVAVEKKGVLKLHFSKHFSTKVLLCFSPEVSAQDRKAFLEKSQP